MILDIVIYGNPVLREKCSEVLEITDDVRTLVSDMLETMIAAHGVGLAAPQVGTPIRLSVIDVSFDPECVSYFRINGNAENMPEWMPLVFFNPELELDFESATDVEGCLSFPEMRAEITRPEQVKGKMTLLDGREVVIETDGLLARAIQHETDHLNGVLFIDRMSAADKLGLKKRIKQMHEEFGSVFRPAEHYPPETSEP